MGAAALAAGLSPFPSGATAPRAERQGPSFYRYTVGTIEVTVVNDGASRMPVTDGFVENASAAEVNAALVANFMEPGIYAGPYNPVVVNTGAKLAVVDTGTGEAAFSATRGLNGRFLMNLASAGIDPASVDCVILSHYHGDHNNGLLRGPAGAYAGCRAEGAGASSRSTGKSLIQQDSHVERRVR